MNKLLVCAAAALLFTSSVTAQKYDLKKGKIIADGTEIAKYSGKGGMFRLITTEIKSLTNEPLIVIKENSYDFENPLKPMAQWLDVSFPNTELPTVQVKLPNRMVEKLLLDTYFFKDGAPALISDNKLNTEAVKAFAAAHAAYNFSKDSAEVKQMEAEAALRLKTPVVRDRNAQITYAKAGQPDAYTYQYDIFQGDVHIGLLERVLTPYGQENKYTYHIYMKTSKYTFNGLETIFTPVAILRNASGTLDNELVFMANKQRLKVKTPNPAAAEPQIMAILIRDGHL
jgi:hypothetical protein